MFSVKTRLFGILKGISRSDSFKIIWSLRSSYNGFFTNCFPNSSKFFRSTSNLYYLMGRDSRANVHGAYSISQANELRSPNLVAYQFRRHSCQPMYPLSCCHFGNKHPSLGERTSDLAAKTNALLLRIQC